MKGFAFMNTTFEIQNESDSRQKETYEWVRAWCEKTNNKDLPRILLVGDSITEGYYNAVKNALDKKAYVDYIATSYSIDTYIYKNIVEGLAKDSDYDVIYFNHGLHGWHITKEAYFSNYDIMIKSLLPHSKIIIATTTTLLDKNGDKQAEERNKKVAERNECALKTAEKYNLGVDDLYIVSKTMPTENRAKDGVHYESDGYELLAASAVESINKILFAND